MLTIIISCANLHLAVQSHQNGLLRTDRNTAKLPLHLDSIAKCLDINAKDYCQLRHSSGMQTNSLLITTTIGDGWPKAEGLLWGVSRRKRTFCEARATDAVLDHSWHRVGPLKIP
jgi:hypothetical protein